MLNKIWRTSHLLIALVSVVFLLLASVSGIILALEPIQEELQPLSIKGAKSITVGELLENLDGQYEEILEIEVLTNDAVKISTFDMDEEKNGDFIINPHTGDKIGDIPPKNQFFQSITNFHRSLFLKSTGRFIIGVTAFLFFLSIVTGFLLLLKREGSLLAIYRKTIKTRWDQYWHVVISKWTVLPLLIIALTGVYLSLLRFEIIPEPPMQALDIEASSVDTRFPVYAFEVFQNMKLGALKKIEFPFSEDDLDPYTVELRDEKLVIHQYTGQVLEAYQSSWISIVSYWSYRLHTGSESIIWSLILGVSTTGVLFLIFSGFSIAYKRFRVKVPQSDAPEEAEYVLLYGSENGSTKAFALALYQALKANQQKVYVNELNKYTQLPNLKRLIILTSTYGEGVAPDNGDQFLEQFRQNPPAQPFDFAVLGFGSLAYPKFCQFAKDVHQELTTVPNAQQLLDVKLIHNQAKQEFFDWTKQLGSSLGLSLTIAQFFKVKKPKLDQFILIDRKIVKVDDQQTYLIALKPDKSHDFQSGDLLNFYPEKDPVKRSYSISKNLSGFILLAIKRHEQGMVSNYLFNLPLGEKVEAQIEHNIHFHFPAEPKSVVLIGNGTGMGPFVGMIEHNKSQSIELYWGGRSSKSFALYRPFIDEALERGRLSKCEIAYSREGEERTYVQTLIRKDGEVLAKKLEQGSHLMICGSIDMQNDVLEVLDTVTKQYLSRPIDYYIEKEQVKMDCY